MQFKTYPDIIGRTGFVDKTLVLWGTTSLLARVCDKGTGGGDGGPFFIFESFLIKLRNRRLPLNSDAVVIDVSVFVKLFFNTSVGHFESWFCKGDICFSR